ncbi:hypothetical protein I5Q34_24165 [Streptomyces sp. AV19]|uniref:hypothetical protein n=1 Tax=Streptomyces sp. AV19 TaxID=2793068 RepID=UPI0018FE97EF|nr:hypothetical protein [Streptomyces sp. AV19]MBH1937328.1 hypothetical protein [Streptomyces sp. AV19]MDG4534673.1 hypothetical protein [Streptomyces sp. AV19]
MARKYGIVVAAAGLAAVVGLTGCGKGGDGDEKSDDKKSDKAASSAPAPAGGGLEKLSGKEISDRAKKELQSATALRFKMTGTKGAESMSVDLAMDKQGNCVGTVGTGTEGTAEVIKIGDQVWMKADEKLWKAKAGPQAAELLKGRYIHGPASDPKLKGMTTGCDLAVLQAKVGSGGDSGKEVTKGAATTVDGQPVVPISADGTTISVASTGRPYPLKIDKSTDGSSVRLTDWNKPVQPKTPPADQTIDIDKLKKPTAGGAL